ncbi:MAG: FtsH protease activity modulator HflK [Myxococcales bacterium]|nr:FtsH protease activity modulator HflK [Myxococcales bacterium]
MAWNPYEQNQSGGGFGGGSDSPEIELPPNLLGWVAVAVVVLGLLLGGRTSFYTVGPDEQAVVLRLGKFNEIAEPGFHVKLPFGVDRVKVFATTRVLKEEFGFRTLRADTRTEYSRQRFDEESLMLSGDLNIADVEWIVQFRIADPKKVWFNIAEPEQTVRDVAESVTRRVVGNRTVDLVLTTGRSRIEDEAKRQMQQVLNSYDSGIKMVALQLQNVTPPKAVQASFNDVNRAEQDREKMENEALAKLNREIPNAKGEAKRTVDIAEGYKVDRINRAKGNVARFLGILKEYHRAPEVTRKRLYLETLGRVLPHTTEITVLDQDTKGVLPMLPLAGGALPGSTGKGGAR